MFYTGFLLKFSFYIQLLNTSFNILPYGKSGYKNNTFIIFYPVRNFI